MKKEVLAVLKEEPRVQYIQYTSNQTMEIAALERSMTLTTGLDDFKRQVLPTLVRILKMHWVGFYIADSRLQEPAYFTSGIPEEIAVYMERSCIIEFDGFTNDLSLQSTIPATTVPHISGNLQYFPVLCGGTLAGLLQLEADVCIINPEQWEKFLNAFSETINRILDS